MNMHRDTDEGRARPSVWPVYLAAAVIGIESLLFVLGRFLMPTTLFGLATAVWLCLAMSSAAQADPILASTYRWAQNTAPPMPLELHWSRDTSAAEPSALLWERHMDPGFYVLRLKIATGTWRRDFLVSVDLRPIALRTGYFTHDGKAEPHDHSFEFIITEPGKHLIEIERRCFTHCDPQPDPVLRLEDVAIERRPVSGYSDPVADMHPAQSYCHLWGWMPSSSYQRLKYNNPVFVDDVAASFPELTIAVCHGGFPWEAELEAVVQSNPNTYVDISFLDYIERALKRPGLAEQAIRRLAAIVGPQRLLWGSEGPFMNLALYGQHGPEYGKRCQELLVRRFDFFTEEEKAAILGGNAAQILGLEREAGSDRR